MKQQTKLSPEQTHTETQSSETQAVREFANADELLRFDAAQTVVPPQIGERLKNSTANITQPKTGWLKRFFN
jgi:hypothetical protein